MSLLAEYIREFGRFQRNARLYLISNALSGITIGIVLVLYNLYLVALGYDTAFIGLLMFVITIGAGIAIFPAGVCVDRFGGKTILIWASVVIAIAGAGQFLFREPLPLLVSGFVAGIGGAFVLVVNAPFLTTNSTSVERPLLFSLNIVLTLITTVIGEVIGGALPLWFRNVPWLMAPQSTWLAWALADSPLARSYQLTLLLAGLIAAPSFIPLFLMSNDRPQSAVMTTPRSTMRLEPRSVYRKAAAWVREQRRVRWRTALWSPVFVMVVVQALVGLGAGLFIPYFNIYFVRHLGASSALFGIIDGGANTLNALLTLVAPWLALRIGKVRTITFTRLLSIPLMLTIGFTGFLPLAALLYLFRQGSMDMAAGILQVFSMEVVPEQHRGLANSSYQAAIQVAWAISAPIGGLIIARQGYGPVFIIGAVLYLLSIALLWGRFRDSEKIQEPGREEEVTAAR